MAIAKNRLLLTNYCTLILDYLIRTLTLNFTHVKMDAGNVNNLLIVY